MLVHPSSSVFSVPSTPLTQSQLVPEMTDTGPKISPASESLKRDFGYGRRALVVDDVSDVTEMLSVLLSHAGYEVVTALSAHGALEAVHKERFDVIISDIGMPEVDGNELIRIIREERGSRIPAVALTAMARIEDRLKALEAGYQMHVAKPIDPAELITLVRGLFELVDRSHEA